MSSQTENLSEEERIIIEDFRKAKQAQFADILISIDKGEMAKCDVTIKRRGDKLRSMRHLKES